MITKVSSDISSDFSLLKESFGQVFDVNVKMLSINQESPIQDINMLGSYITAAVQAKPTTYMDVYCSNFATNIVKNQLLDHFHVGESFNTAIVSASWEIKQPDEVIFKLRYRIDDLEMFWADLEKLRHAKYNATFYKQLDNILD